MSAPFVPARPRHGFLVICADGAYGDAHPRAPWAFRRTADPKTAYEPRRRARWRSACVSGSHGDDTPSNPDAQRRVVERESGGVYAFADLGHLPAALRLIEALAARAPNLPQVACFDTAFHHTMPEVARLLPIPRRYQGNGVRRYGFHGLSCQYLVDELTRLAGTDAAHGRVLLAHLGNGASITAVRDGRSLDTSMGFTPAAGLVMGTRTGDLDPGVVRYLTRIEHMTADQFDRMANHESGLLGVSGISSDMRELLAHEPCDERAAAAVALFCYQARKWIGALATVLGGVDTLVFAGGIGERSAVIRARICEGLAFLGIEIDEERNRTHAAVVSPAHVPVAVRIIPTSEELMIARSVVRVLGVA